MIQFAQSPESEPKLYNATLLENYAQYLKIAQPEIDVKIALQEISLEPIDTVNPSIWVTQSQYNIFYNIISRYYRCNDGVPLARAAARFASTTKFNKIIHRTTMSLASCNRIFAIFDKITKKQSRAFDAQTRQISPTSYEIILTYKNGVSPEQFQCDSVLGYLETICIFFTNRLPHTEHPECVFKGDNCCRYLVNWKIDTGKRLARSRSIALFAGTVLTCISIGMQMFIAASIVAVFIVILVLSLSLIMEHKERKRISALVGNYESQYDPVIDGYNKFHDYTKLFGEFAKFFASRSSVQDVLDKLSISLSNLDFNKGLICLINNQDKEFRLALMYGYNSLPINMAIKIRRHFDTRQHPEAYSVHMLHDAGSLKSIFSEDILQDACFKEIENPVYLPIMYEQNLIGFGLLNYARDSQELIFSDLSLMEAIAAQTALAITNIASLETVIQNERLKNQFVTVASHELRTPIQAIMLGYDGLVEELSGMDRNQLGTSLEVIEKGVFRLERIVTNILNLSKIEARNSMDESCIPINELIRQLSNETAHIMQSCEHAMQINPSECETYNLHCDPVLLLQVFTNMVTNAAKFSPKKGQILITFYKTAADLAIDIVDNGLGIPKDAIEKVFIKFFQVKRDGPIDNSGCGLGLSFCQEVIRKHGGYISVESPLSGDSMNNLQLGGKRKGTKFTIHIPLERIEKAI